MKKVLVCCLAAAMLFSASSCKPKDDGAASNNKGEDTESMLSDITDESDITDDSTGQEASDTEGNSAATSKSGTSKSGTSKSGTSKSGSSKSNNSTTGGTDLDGYEFKYAIFGDIPTKNKDDYTDAVVERNKRIEKKFNCKIVYDVYDATKFAELAKAKIMSNAKDFADVMQPTIYGCGAMINNQLLYNLDKLPNFDKNASYWDQVFFENTTLKSGTYGAGGQLNAWKTALGAVIYNKELIKSMQLTDPAELVKANNWNWDTFKELVSHAAKDLNADGAFTAKDQWACGSLLYDGVLAFYQSSGDHMLTIDKNHNIAYGLDNAKAQNSLAKMKDIFSTPGAMFDIGGTSYHRTQDQFIDGKIVFMLATGALTSKNDYAKMKDKFGVVPMPIGPNANGKYIAGITHNATILCVPKYLRDPAKTGLVLSALAEEADKDKDIFINAVTDGYRDKEDKELAKKHLFPNATFDVSMLYKMMSIDVYSATECVVGNPIILDTNTNVTTLMDTYKAKCIAEISKISGK